jgi:hypothetical protein
MMLMIVRRGVLAGLVLFLTACGAHEPTAPSAISQPPQTNFPPLSGPSRSFTFDHEVTYQVSDYTKQSRFVLYDDGAFVLQYVSLRGEYRGDYTGSNGVITFEWEGWSSAGPWGATGALKDGSLTLHYNVIMQLTDFEDAVYRLTP